MPEKYGIDELQKILDAAFAMEKLIVADLADKKISLAEVFGIAFQLYSVQGFLANKVIIKQQIDDLSADEIKILVRNAATTINNQQISDLVEKVFLAIELGIGLFQAVKALLKKKNPAPPVV